MTATLRPTPATAGAMLKLRERVGQHLVQPWPTAGKIGVDSLGMVGDGEGVYILHEDGRRLIDGPAGMWCVNAGHRNAALADTLREQAMSLSYASPWYTTTSPALKLAERIAAYAPGDLDRVFLTTGGTSAVETALRFMFFLNNVKGRPEKKLIVTRHGAYHGASYLTGSLNSSAAQMTGGPDLRPPEPKWMDTAEGLVLRLSCPNPFRRPEGMDLAAFADHLVEEFRQLIERVGADRIGAFIGEPIQASGGVIVPPPGYLKRMRELCRENDILFIADEVVTAFGRLGHVFASQEVFDIDPDMITFAKGVTSGYFPLGGVMMSAAMLEDLRKSNHPEATFAHGLTYSSHPIGCAVALKNLDLLEGGLLAQAQANADYFQTALKTLEVHGLVGEVRGMGLMACIECVADKQSHDPFALDLEVGKRIDRHCQERGLMVRPLVQMCVMSPPLVITRPQIDTMVSILDEAIRATMDDLVRDGLWRG
ncbi:MAG: aminotransferase [Rhodobacteraceae bacterium]|nr:aminotransferase [Paracoccaceae bacterium]